MSGPRHEYCPRCLTKRHQPVPLIASSLFRHAAKQGEGIDTAAGSESTSSATLDLDPA
jgi:hypothetical protein